MTKYKYPPETGIKNKCTVCDNIKDDAYFKQRFGRRVGLVCRECSNASKRISNCTEQERKERAAKSNKYYHENKVNISKQRKEYREANSDKIKEAKRNYHVKNADKIKARSALWYKENKEAYLKRCKEKYVRNKEKLCEAGRIRYRNNKELYKENFRLWRLNNPRAITAYVRQYNLAKLNRTPSWANVKEINNFYRNCPPNLQVDHIHPLQGKNISGLHVIENLQYLTKEENTSKSNRFYTYWVTYEKGRITIETSGPEASVFTILR